MFLKILFFKRLVVLGPDETPVRVPKALNEDVVAVAGAKSISRR